MAKLEITNRVPTPIALDSKIPEYKRKFVEAFEREDIKEIQKIVSEQPNHTQCHTQLIYGPLPKTKYTYLFENIVRLLLNNAKMVHRMNDDKIVIWFPEIDDGFNLTEVLDKTNFTHLKFSKIDFKIHKN